ncbi:hypothetical protein BpHYR1_005264 [Brachionus plicatilis]|uniref:Uncharacterized protein n=1 Tax=Brachionus plicatilis TaxID=10195 RepID=A0A3M7R628_BRAPC|nr:hypothetical protein BpHYR1_005264 [Brachionus plicatilis]
MYNVTNRVELIEDSWQDELESDRVEANEEDWATDYLEKNVRDKKNRPENWEGYLTGLPSIHKSKTFLHKKALSRAPSAILKKLKHKGVDILTKLDVKHRLYSFTNLAISDKRRSVMDSNLNIFPNSERLVLLVRKVNKMR